MKTNYFSTYTLDDDEKSKIKSLQTTNNEIFEDIYNWLLQQTALPRLSTKIIKQFVDKFNTSPKKIEDFLSSLFLIIRLFSDYKDDNPEDIIHDLRSIDPQLVVDEEKLLSRLKLIAALSKKYQVFLYTYRTKRDGALLLEKASTSIIYKPVIEKRFDFDKMDIKDYKPKILKYQSGVLICLQMTNNESITFQMGSEEFDIFLNELISLQIELNASTDGINK